MGPERIRYSGHSRKLVVALDIETTFSGAAYALPDPGKVPHGAGHSTENGVGGAGSE